MKQNQNNLKNSPTLPNKWITCIASKLVFFTVATLSTTVVIAGSPTPADASNAKYVDSIHQWGAWELDIEPAAGGIQQQTTQPLGTRYSQLELRTNSIAAVAPQRPVTFINTVTAPTVVPPAPVTPPVVIVFPVVTPIGPGTPPTPGAP